MISIDLAGKAALVTGASQGLGAAIATRLHQAGAQVALNYFADPAGVNRQRAQQVASGLSTRVMLVEADVRDPDAVRRMVAETTAQFGRLDIVVNNAGILRDRTLRKLSEADWQAVIDTNLTGVFHVCQAAESALADGGRIINLASIAAVVGFFGQSNYAAAKAGVVALTKVLSKELARRQITVNAVAPGVVETEMGQSIPEAARQKMLEAIPLGRFGAAEEIADAVLFFASDLARYVSGQLLHVNGGWIG